MLISVFQNQEFIVWLAQLRPFGHINLAIIKHAGCKTQNLKIKPEFSTI
jgi:hypothetical protein